MNGQLAASCNEPIDSQKLYHFLPWRRTDFLAKRLVPALRQLEFFPQFAC